MFLFALVWGDVFQRFAALTAISFFEDRCVMSRPKNSTRHVAFRAQWKVERDLGSMSCAVAKECGRVTGGDYCDMQRLPVVGCLALSADHVSPLAPPAPTNWP